MSFQIRTLPTSLALTLALATLTPRSASTQVSSPLGALVDDYLTRMEAFGFAGSVAVEKDAVLILEKGYGLANMATGQPITSTTVFDIGSIAKQFLATAALKLESQGKLRLTDSISRHLPDVPADKRGITIHQLLTHSSGLPYQPTADPPLTLPLAFTPGSRYAYSNPGYTLLAMIVDRVAAEPYEQFIERELFRPAGLTRTMFIGAQQPTTVSAARGYIDGRDVGTAWDLPQGGPYRGAGGVASTPGDLARWHSALKRGTILDSVRVAQLFTEQIRNPGASTGYSYGWMTGTTLRNTPIVMHGGNYAAFNSDFRIYPAEGLVVTLLSSHFVEGRSMRDAVMNGISTLINGGMVVAMPPAVTAAPDSIIRAVRGSYALQDGGSLVLSNAAGALDVRAADQRSMHHIFAPNASDSARAFAERASAIAERVVNEMLRGESATLLSVLSPSIQRQGLAGYLTSLATSARDSVGASPSARAAGTALSGAMGGVSSVRITGTRDTTFIQLTWTAGQVIGIEPANELPSRRFLPTGTNTFTAFNIFTGWSATISTVGAANQIRVSDAAGSTATSVTGRRVG